MLHLSLQLILNFPHNGNNSINNLHVGVSFKGVIYIFHNSLNQDVHLLFRLSHFPNNADVKGAWRNLIRDIKKT